MSATRKAAPSLVRRELSLVRPTEAEPADSRVRLFVASNECVDRYNTVIKAAGWKLDNYERNPVVLFGHDGRGLPIGKGTATVEGTSLMLAVEFLSADENPLAEQALRILDKGLMGVSVGFNPLESEYDESRETGDEWQDFFFPPLNYTATELLEVSVVTIPANPEALPVGREAPQVRRFLERTMSRMKPTPPVNPPELPPEAPAPKPQPAPMSTDELRALVAPLVAREVREARAARARRLGVTT